MNKSTTVSVAHEAPLRVVREHPLVAETPPEALQHSLTPSESVYVRSNFPTPALEEPTHQLTVAGAVQRPLVLSMSDLRSLPSRTVVMTMECAGNDRLGMRPVPPGEPWNTGAVSTVRWRGVSLRDVLLAAGVASSAIEVVAWGADIGHTGARDDEPFARSLPLDIALDTETLLAYEMNGAALTPDHGFPVRLVVPGWYGMASVKWLTKLEVVNVPFGGYFQRERYVYDVNGRVDPVTRVRVKSMITSPSDGTELQSGVTEVQGWAWSGYGAVVAVEVACDDQPATAARLGEPESPHAWTPWSATLHLPPGDHVLRSRATDASGAVQPDVIEWNRLGYGNNAVKGIHVRAGLTATTHRS